MIRVRVKCKTEEALREEAIKWAESQLSLIDKMATAQMQYNLAKNEIMNKFIVENIKCIKDDENKN